MEPNVRVIHDPESDRRSPSLENFLRIATLLDSKFQIPGTTVRFGLDPILSLVPLLGDVIAMVISSILIYSVYTHGASRKVVIKMMLNVGLDALIGAIPIIGTVFDVFYRSNQRNLKLLKEHYFEGKHQGSGTNLLIAIVAIAIVIIAAVVYGVWEDY